MRQNKSRYWEDDILLIISLSKNLSYGIIVLLSSCWGLAYSAQAQPLSQKFQKAPANSTLPKLTEPLPEGTEAKPPLLAPAPEPISIPEPETPLPDSTAYTLGGGDRIQIDIFNIPEYSGKNGQHQVQIDGTLNLPLVGNVLVEGKTLDEAKELIQEKYSEYLQISIVNLNLLAARPLKIAIAGEVQHPGSYTISPIVDGGEDTQSGTQLPTVTKALQVAGGVTTSADVRQIKIRRTQLNAPEQVININLWELLQDGNLRQDIPLRDGDTLFVPSITEVNPVESSQLVNANFAGTNTQPLNIAVVGEVARPGPYILETGIDQSQLSATEENSDSTEADNNISSSQNTNLHTVTKAIKMAGGITPSADIRQIMVRRLTRAGTEQVIKVDLWQLLQNGDLNQDLVLESGDTIYVPVADEVNLDELAEVTASSFSPGNLKINLIGEVVNPGIISMVPNSTLNQALLAAGGFNQGRAETEEVELIRLNPNGTVTRRQVQVDFSAKVNEETNPTLLNNDVILVGRSGRAALTDNVRGVLAPFSPINRILGVFLDIFD
ncbi:MAG: polysaccharide export protein [Okeania sp. SIO2G4]|uniref:polysaccharide biosynthesis/export family protein n=1 Tax=unclassified Okeania TaxID=2634635 RepID=UPI0013B6A3D4|nr:MULTISPECIES: SLBB domain-containing protein [unclassified Okeania]NEP05939.1 polysaccharide export protein [Okeania sp. SIO4D6]NEP71771.1 polysaccharide export protein [Okeania sp. SIO2G5]NEP92457.1 polysaccharide export protein [Okeania sp. SIO2F5]NEQ90471.1 polysaccharide export protein [Okeania sp. SIO2G4]